MSSYEYRQLLKFLYFEGYADSYQEADYLLEEMNDDEFSYLYEEVIENKKIINHLLDEGYAETPEAAEAIMVNMSEEWRDNIFELYKGRHGQSETEYQNSRSNAGKMVSGDSTRSGAAYSSRGVKNTGPNPAGGSTRPQAQGRMTRGQRAEMQYRKANLKKD